MSLNNYKKIRINSGGERVLYFDGSGASGTLFPSFADTFDVRINQNDLTNRDLLVTDDTTARVDVQGLNGEPIIRIDLKVYSYQLLDEIEADGGTDADEDYSHGVYEALGDYDYSLACSCSQYKTGSLYYGTGSFPAEDYQVVFTDGDKIITGIETETGVWNLIPPKTSRIEIKPFVTAVKLPVRAKDIANDDGEILDTVAIAGATGAVGDRIQYLDSSGELTELITAGTADFIQTVISRPEFSSKQNNVPSKGQVLLMSYDGTGGLTDNEISGFTAGTAGKLLRVINVGSNTIVLSANDTGSSAGNRILGSDVSLGQYESATLIYVEDYVDGLSTTNIDAWILISNT
jgi:hypothetical protein